jgi:hypothetical protein
MQTLSSDGSSLNTLSTLKFTSLAGAGNKASSIALSLLPDGNLLIHDQFHIIDDLFDTKHFARIHFNGNQPEILTPSLDGETFSVLSQTLPEYAYELQRKSLSKGSDWETVQTLPGTGDSVLFEDEEMITGGAIYRVIENQ